MSRSRVLIILALAAALIGLASAQLSATAGAAAASATRSAGLAMPAPAASPIDTVTDVSAAITETSGVEELVVTADSTSPLSDVLAHLWDTSTSADTLDLTLQETASDPDTGSSTWTAPVTEGTPPDGLPLGTYDVTVDVTFADGTVITGVDAAPPVAFQDTPSITLQVNSVLSHDNEQPTLTGTVTMLAPGSTTPVAYADQPVVLEDSVLNQVTLTTDANGDFSFPFTDPQAGEQFTVAVQPTTTVAGATTPATTFTVQTDQVAISASLSAKSVTYGSKVTVGGTVSYDPDGTSEPLPTETVDIYDGPDSSTPVATAVTNSAGGFSAVLPKEPASMDWVLRAGGEYLSAASVTLPMKVSLPTVISGFQATLNTSWQVGFRGCLALPAGTPGYIPSLSGLTIQYAAGPNGPWHTLGAVPKQSVVCGNGGWAFSGTLEARLNYAYYRAWYAGTTNVAGTGYLSAASGKVLAWKYEDRITSFSVSKRTVGKGAKLTVSGILQFYSGGWRNYANQQVRIIFLEKGSKIWYYMLPVPRTNSSGKFSETFTDPASATWSAEYLGNSTHLATVAAMIIVTVK